MRMKIVFMVINMNVGGTEKALLNMIREMPANKFDITLVMLEEYGGFLDRIPEHVHVTYINEYPNIKGYLNRAPKTVITGLFRQRKITKGMAFTAKIALSKITKNKNILLKYVLKGVPNLEEEYDVAVAYAGPMDVISYFVINKIKAKKKIQWIHFDVTKIGFDKGFASRIYKCFDRIFTVSVEGKQKLSIIVPHLKERIEMHPNKVLPGDIHKLAHSGVGFFDGFDGIRILTVGRLAKEKGQDIGIKVLAKLKENGYNVKWYCVGEGGSRKQYEGLINMYNLNNDFILLGASANPYPYIAQCDIYVQPSRHEGYCFTLAEARLLHKPIVTTDFTGAKEQTKDGKLGLVVNVDEHAIYQGVKKLLDDKNLCEAFTNYLKKEPAHHSNDTNDYFAFFEDKKV